MSASGPNEGESHQDFVDRVALNMSMSKRDVIDAFLQHFPRSTEQDILDAFINLSNAPDDATIIFRRSQIRGIDCLCGEIQGPDGKKLIGDVRADARTGQPVQRIS